MNSVRLPYRHAMRKTLGVIIEDDLNDGMPFRICQSNANVDALWQITAEPGMRLSNVIND